MGKLLSSHFVVLMMIMMMMVRSYDLNVKVEASLSDEDEGKCLSVATSVFANTLKTTIDGVLEVASLVANFEGSFGDFRVSTAISDCLDLLQLSSDELNWSLSASQHGKGNGTGDLASDLKTWLSAALGNQETCLEGLAGTGGIVESLVSGSIGQVSTLIREVLHMVHLSPPPVQSSRSGRAARTRPGAGGRRLMSKVNDKNDEFPSWIRLKDRKLLQANEISPDVVVAQDGSGNFTNIMDAIEAAPNHSMDRFVIYVKEGVYDENVEIKKKKTNIMMYGDGMDVTIITGNRSVMDGWTTYRCSTFAVTGAGFIGRNMTFQNTAGPEKHQAVAYRSDSDLSVLYRCAFRGYQDTLYTHANRHFFRECTITGTVDFIFGDGVVVFQSCQIQARQGLSNQKNAITAQGRKDPGENTGFSIQFCNITGDSSLMANTSSNATNSTYLTNTYLGRPWKAYSRTIIMKSYISDVVRPEGWLEWNSNNASLDTLYYAEYMNYGPGATLSSRVNWAGYHIFNSSAQALNYTVAQFIDGDMWLPTTGVRFASGLSA